MKWHLRAVLLLMVIMLGISVVACEKKGSAEKAGEKIDNAFSNAKEKIHDATK